MQIPRFFFTLLVPDSFQRDHISMFHSDERLKRNFMFSQDVNATHGRT